MLVEKIYILGALLKLPFFTHDEEMKNWANSYLTFHSCSQRTPTDGFAEQNGRDAERSGLTYSF